VLSGAYVVSNSFGGGRTGEIRVDAGTLAIEGNAVLQGSAYATGDATSIFLRTGNIELRNGGQVITSANGTGRGGAIFVDNAGRVRIEGTRTERGRDLPVPSGFFSNTHGSGNAGSIAISTRTLDVVAGGEISSTAIAGAAGNGGSIAVSASESIRVSGTDAGGYGSGIVTNTFGPGNAGEILLAAPSIEITNDGKVQSQSEGGGRAGRIRIEGGDLAIRERGQISSDAKGDGAAGAVELALSGTLTISGDSGSRSFDTGIFAKTYGAARGGSISIEADRIVLTNKGGIFATTDGSGSAGVVVVRANETIAMDSGSLISTSTGGTGDAGAVSIYAGERLSMSGDAHIVSESRSAGRGGTLDVRTDGAIVMVDRSAISTSADGTGNAGDVHVRARDGISLSRGAAIASASLSTGLAGNVDVATNGLLELREGGQITTQALSSDGGNLTVTANGAFLDTGRITTEVGTGLGAGGNMEIRIPLLVLRNSQVSANAFGGPGGNIHIATRTFIPSANSSVTASSQLGVDGTITLESPALDPTGELLLPAVAFFDAGSVLAGRCGPRLAGRASSLVVEPRRLADVAPDTLRSMLEILAPETASTCQPAAAARS
jgi:large exoprotein involved in heme utilization and adhesion